MLKKCMLYLMMLIVAIRVVAFTVLLLIDPGRLPEAVFISSGIVALCGIIFTVQHFRKGIVQKNLAVFYGLSMLSVIFNLIIMKALSRIEVTMLDFLLIGTFLDILINAVMLFLAVREHKYVRIKMKSDQK